MDSRERYLIGAWGFDWEWWIFSLSFSMKPLRVMQTPKWLAWFMCKLGKHDFFIFSGVLTKAAVWKCLKCGVMRNVDGVTIEVSHTTHNRL